jgi:prepilin-type N-terminal cleavage/methylation domain-containing protein
MRHGTRVTRGSEKMVSKSIRESGFSLIELTLVMMVLLVLAAIAIPNMLQIQHTSRMRGAVADFTGLIESERMYAIRDNRFYSTYILTATDAPSQVFIDMIPKSNTPPNWPVTSGNGGTTVVAGQPGVTGDPVINIPSEVGQQPVANAPDTSNLQSQLLPSSTGVTPTDASVTPFTFSPRGLPCAPLTVTGGTVCDSSGGPVAYWTFFQDSVSHEWDAVTATPAGKISKWYYTGSAWNAY